MELGPLPNGWECKYDHRTRKNYFINYVNKTTTWDDPRVKPHATNAPPPYQEPSDLISLQPQLHGTPDHRSVYPSYPAHYHPQPAFQMPNPYMQEILQQDVTSYRPSPVPGRAHTAPLMGSYAISHHVNSKIQETSFNNPNSTEQSVAKISAMFPTVAETHIRALLINGIKSSSKLSVVGAHQKLMMDFTSLSSVEGDESCWHPIAHCDRYHSRDAVVISALQVEKNPLTTPGPFSTPPLSRHIVVPSPVPPPHYHSTPPSGLRDFCSTPPPSLYSCGIGTGAGTLTGSPASSSYLGSPAFRHSPRPHSSPKMKLRYMKSMFPKADETIILDTLYNVENNVQAATNKLQAMGFDKRDVPPSRAATPLSKSLEVDNKNKEEEGKELKSTLPTQPARLRSVDEKQDMCKRLKKIYPDLIDHLISMALDSVDYDENRAVCILNLMIKEESTPKSTHVNSDCSSQRPRCKSDAAEASSTETKTTIEADVSIIEDQGTHSSPQELVPESGNNRCPDSGIEASTENCNGSQEAACARNSTDKTASQASLQSTLPLEKSTGKKVKIRKDISKVSRGTSTTEDKEYRSPLRLTTTGPSLSLHFGPNDELLLEDYVTWKGPTVQTGLKGNNANGPNISLISSRIYAPKGPNRDLRKGSKPGLAKGSVYSHLSTNNNIANVVGKSRGK